MEWVTEYHDSLQEFINTVADRAVKHDDGYDTQWHGNTNNVGEALEIAQRGWQEVRPKVDQARSEIMGKVRNFVNLDTTPTWHVAGGVVDMGEFMTGNPECMITFPVTEQSTMKRSLRLVLDPGGNAGVNANELATRGAAVATLLEVLQLMGFSLEVMIASPVRGTINGKIYTPVIKANEAGSLVDIDNLMFACGHPAMLRRMIFTERLQHSRNMGSSVALDVDALGLHDIDLVMQRAEHRSGSEPDAGYQPVEWILWALRNLEIPLG